MSPCIPADLFSGMRWTFGGGGGAGGFDLDGTGLGIWD